MKETLNFLSILTISIVPYDTMKAKITNSRAKKSLYMCILASWVSLIFYLEV
jgi:hypothetical protein